MSSRETTKAERANPPAADGASRNLTFGLLDTLGRAIVTGAYEMERFPTEAELADIHAVSRSVTREAVKMLTAKGLLTARPRKGTTVLPSSAWNLFDPDVLRWIMERKFSLELLRQFSELRIAIEPAAAALAAQAGSADAIAAIAAGYARMESAEAGGGDTLEADIDFHVAVLDASANPFYMRFRNLVASALQTSIRFTNRFKGRTASLPQHAAVLAAIQAGDPEAARAGMAAIIHEVMIMIADAERGEGP
ncbi:MAG: FadR family transcriptional regulator [Alphaproteobacteria bacterium]|nr:MAG: FadR family transcriptional regulator [Alphaproteobacteria bacterium]